GRSSTFLGILLPKSSVYKGLRVCISPSSLPFYTILFPFAVVSSECSHKDPTDEQKGIGRKMDMKLELVPVPVSDVDRAKAFYIEKCGFQLEVDVQPTDTMRVVQFTPPGSACSIVFGTGMGEITEMQPG